jgi:hypothetical protein
MRVLIAVCSYQGDAENGNHDAIRQTWGKDCAPAGADLRFFVGRRFPEYAPKSNEILIDWEQARPCGHPFEHSEEGCCPDFWQKLTKEILNWSLDNGYDYTFLCENDTFLIPRQLIASGFEKYDFSGHFIPIDTPIGTKTKYDMWGHRLYPWPEPGAGYFLSRKAATAVIYARPSHWPLGVFASQALGYFIENFIITAAELPNFWNEASWHYRAVTGEGYPAGSNWQREMYKRHND